MYQQEIRFFFPLTEQIPLDLDYSDCARKVATTKVDYTTSTIGFNSDGYSFISANVNPSELTVAVDKVTFEIKEKPNWLRKIVYRIIGVNWKLK